MTQPFIQYFAVFNYYLPYKESIDYEKMVEERLVQDLTNLNEDQVRSMVKNFVGIIPGEIHEDFDIGEDNND